MKKIQKNDMYHTIISIVRTLLIVIAVSMKMTLIPYDEIDNDNTLIRAICTVFLSVNSFGIIPFLAVLFLYKPVRSSFYERHIDNRGVYRIPAILFSAFMIIGYSFQMENSYYLLFGDWDLGQTCKTVIQFVGYYNLFYVVLEHLWNWLHNDTLWRYKETDHKVLKWMFDEHPVKAVFLILFIFWSIYLLAFFPGFIQGDTPDQLEQFMGIKGSTASYLNLLSEDVYLNNHHPVLHTLLLGFCFKIGHVLGSDNLGIFIYVILQYSLVCFAIATGVKYLKKLQLPYWMRMVILAFYMLTPIYVNYAILTTKDVIYSVCLLWFTLYLAELLMKNGEPFYKNMRNALGFAISCFGCVFFRHNGIYILVLTLALIAIIWKKYRKFSAISIVSMVVALMLVNSVIYPALKITGGSRREALSVPLQQTARYISEHGEDLTQEEYEIIDKVIDVEFCKFHYEPAFADPVKATFHEDVTSEDLHAYFVTWFKMFWKHPGCYVQAFVNNTYGYFYYGDEAVWKYDKTESENVQGLINPEGFDIHHISQIHSLSTLIELCIGVYNNLPIVSLFHTSAFYSWILIIITIWMWAKNRKALVLICPMILSLLVCLVSPLNGTSDMRYMFPIVFQMPVMTGIVANIMFMHRNTSEI